MTSPRLEAAHGLDRGPEQHMCKKGKEVEVWYH